MNSYPNWFSVAVLLMIGMGHSAAASPDAAIADDRLDAAMDRGELHASEPAPEAALPYATRARHAQPGVTVTSRGGYDASSGAAVISGVVEATVIDRVAVHAAINQDAASSHLHTAGGITLDVLRQANSGVDLALGGDYDSQGWNRVPAAIGRVAVARRFGDVQVLANAAIGFGTEDGERFGEVELAGLRTVAPRLRLGFDSHAAIDLERDAAEPVAETDWGIQAGPVATYTVGPVALSAFTGVSSWKLRLVNQTYTGVIGSLGAAIGF
jgi:hypothetical protein